MIDITEFKKDLKNLQELERHADRMQQVMTETARNFSEKWRNTILANESKNIEFNLYLLTGWNHHFYFDLKVMHKRQRHKITQASAYISIDEFEKLTPTGETLEDRQPK